MNDQTKGPRLGAILRGPDPDPEKFFVALADERGYRGGLAPEQEREARAAIVADIEERYGLPFADAFAVMLHEVQEREGRPDWPDVVLSYPLKGEGSERFRAVLAAKPPKPPKPQYLVSAFLQQGRVLGLYRRRYEAVDPATLLPEFVEAISRHVEGNALLFRYSPKRRALLDITVLPDGPPEKAVGILARAGLGTGGVENYARVEDAPGDLRAAWGSDTATKEG